jgi:hypothetical protein
MTILDRHAGLRSLVAEGLSDGRSVAQITATVNTAYSLEVTDRTLWRWLTDPAVRRLAQERATERERRIHRQARAQLADRLREGDTADLSTLDLLRISKDSAATTGADEITSHGFPDQESSAIAELWLLASKHGHEIVDEYPALASMLDIRTPKDGRLLEEDYA